MIIEQWIRETRQAGRRIVGAPVFAATVTLVFMTAVGIASAVTSLATATLQQAVPYPDPGNLVRLFEFNRGQDIEEMQVSVPTLAVWRAESRVFEAIGAAHTPLNVTLTTGGELTRLAGGLVSPEMFDVLRVQPLYGRPFTAEEGAVGSAEPSVILSHELWTTRFGGDVDLLGRTVTINGTAWTVVGILPPGVPLLPNVQNGVEIWLPIGQAPAIFGRDISFEHTLRIITAIGRLRPGVSPSRVAEEMQVLGARMEEQFPETSVEWEWGTRSLRDLVTGQFDDAIRALVVGALMLFAVAIANVMGLFAQRARATLRGAWVRMTLGASSADLRRAAVTEAALLALPGTALGVALARWAVAGRDWWIPFPLPAHIQVGLDIRVVLGAFVIAGLVAWLSGAVTAAWWRRTGDQANVGGRAAQAVQSWVSGRVVIGVQVSLAAVLTVVGMLTLFSLVNLLGAETGVRAERLLTARVDVPSELRDASALARTADDIVREIAALPQVATAALWSPHVPAQAVWFTAVRLESRPDLVEVNELPLVRINAVGPGAVTMLGLQFAEGRDFTVADKASGRRVALVSESAAREWWGDGPALGRQIMRWRHEDWSTVIGVVRDAPLSGREGDGSDFVRDVYLLHEQDPQRYLVFLARAHDDDPSLVTSVQQAIRRAASDLPVYDVRWMGDILADQEQVGRSTATLGLVFALAALVLVVVGLYGILTTFVAHKAFEISLRKALGATSARIVGEVTAPVWLTLLLGSVAGLGVAWAVAPQMMAGTLFEIDPRNGIAFAIAGLILLVATAPAILGPAMRGSGRNPAEALRRGVG